MSGIRTHRSLRRPHAPAWIIVSLAVCIGGWLGGAGAMAADAESRKSERTLDSILVTARRLADEEIKKQVEEALHTDPYFYDGHVTVTIKDGVVTLSGVVFDEWDLRTAKRIAKRIAGVRRVVDDLEIKLGGE